MAIVRVSGACASLACARLTGRLPAPRQAALAAMRDADGAVVDRGLVLWFPGPASYTGEDVVEFHVHGGRAVVAELCQALGSLNGLRPAEPGEFTRRAFVNGRMDLTAAEAVGDLVAAETAAQRRQALRQLEGDLGGLYETWRQTLIRALAHVEAEIDFVDEDLPDAMLEGRKVEVREVAGQIADHLADARRGERLREGLTIAIIGPPNAGKSSLMNCLAQREVAIVASKAGTTRDVVEARLDLGGFPVTVADTAGLREAEEEVEAEGVRRARQRAENADLVVAVLDGAVWPEVDRLTWDMLGDDSLVVLNKSDLVRARDEFDYEDRAIRPVSCRTGAGISGLVAALGERVAERFAAGSGPVLTRERHRSGLEAALRALKGFDAEWRPELAAEELRNAVQAIGRITGRVDVEDILDRIFADFCIGK